jgi:cytochrome P450
MVDSDDEYNGHFIPKGSIILPNMGAIASDATIYPDPEAFKPERHLGEAPELDSGAYNFGFGRRCVFFLPFLVPLPHPSSSMKR